MKFDFNYVKAGLGDAIEHMSSEDIKPSDDLIYATQKKLDEVLNRWPYELHGRFVKDFSEAVMIAEACRDTFGEPQLDEDLIVAFLGHSVAFFNSWTHP